MRWSSETGAPHTPRRSVPSKSEHQIPNNIITEKNGRAVHSDFVTLLHRLCSSENISFYQGQTQDVYRCLSDKYLLMLNDLRMYAENPSKLVQACHDAGLRRTTYNACN